MVVGCGGAGKSTLARGIAARTGLPLVHLDRHYWRPGWQEPGKHAWREQVAVLAAAPRWIMDGNFGTRSICAWRAPTRVIVLDPPTWRCLLGVLTRAARWYGRSREDMAPGCPERIDGAFLRYVWRYRRTHPPRVLALLRDFPGDRVHLRGRRAARGYLATLRPTPDDRPARGATANGV
jgi:adenylate kinase family enzyme